MELAWRPAVDVDTGHVGAATLTNVNLGMAVLVAA
jgi:hypothetical protein